jgi:hypothetical protein
MPLRDVPTQEMELADDLTSMGPAEGTGAAGVVVHSPIPALAQVALSRDAPEGPGMMVETQSYLCVLHQVIAAFEPVVELWHPPGSDDLDTGQGSQDCGGPSHCLLLAGPYVAELASLGMVHLGEGLLLCP